VYQFPDRFRRITKLHRAVGALLAFVVTACGPPEQPAGREAERARTPLRIVSLSHDVSRVLVELGVANEIIAADGPSGDVPGMTPHTNLGSLDETSIEIVASLAPDMVIGLAEARSSAFSNRLVQLGVPVTLLPAGDVNEVLVALQRIGVLVDEVLRSRRLSARITRDVARVAVRRDGRSRTSVALVIGCDPLAVIGGAGLVHETLELAGAENVFHEPSHVRRSLADGELRERAPEIVLDASGRAANAQCVDATGWPTRIITVPASLAEPATLDLLSRVTSLHEILYGTDATIQRQLPSARDAAPTANPRERSVAPQS
jgi:ABC-type Fe3+-hydroxamate transport system substrate-binding protein